MSSSSRTAAPSVSAAGGGSDRKTRLMITKMVLENFKSYAGAQEIGPLHKRFSSIVGPNGSGKSNVIDALLFVFGAKAKKLRLNKVSQLIHKSSGFPDLEYAQVEVHFQLIYDNEESDDDFEVVPGSEFVVSRVAYKSNQSKYTVDGKTSTFTEVGVLLRKHGIDLDNNRFLILQGEVEQIAMMKPKGQNEHDEGLLEYLEDIIGSNQFKPQIEELGKSLEAFNEQRVEKVTRLKAAEKERDNLSGSKAEAEAFLGKEKEIRRLKNALYQAHEAVALDNIKDFIVRRDEAKEKLEKERLKQKDSESELVQLEKTYTVTKKEHDQVKKELDSAEANFAAYERKDLELQENIKHTKAQVDKLKQAVAKDQKKEDECVKDADAASAVVATTKTKIDEVTANKATEEARLEEILEGLRGSTQELRNKLEVAQAELADAERATASIQTEKESAQTSLQLLRSRADNAIQSVSNAESKLNQLRDDAVKNNERIVALETEKKQVEEMVRSMQLQAERSASEEGPAQANLRTAITACEEAKATVTAQQQNGSGRKHVELEKIMAAAKKGGPLADAGIWGRLGDLGTIPTEYDVAISTACGMLDHIVVETTEGAQKCVDFLRERNIGRANFMLLNQVAQYKSAMERPFRAPTGSQRLFDLITPTDPRLSVAFYMALKDTLVASDLDTAMAAAYQGDKAIHRVVSQDGNVIELSGAMSGGGKVVRSGAMKMAGKGSTKTSGASAAMMVEEEIITPAQIVALEAKVQECEGILSRCRASKTMADKNIKEGTLRLSAIATDIRKLKIVIDHGLEQEQGITTRIDTLRAETDLSADEKKDLITLQARIDALDADIARTSPNATIQKRAVAALQAQIRNEGGPKLAAAQDKLTRLASQMDILSKQMVTKEVEEKNLRKQAIKSSQARIKGAENLASAESKLVKFQKEVADMEEIALVMITAVESAKACLNEKEVLLQESGAAYDKLKKKLDVVLTVLKELEAEKVLAEKEVKAHEGMVKAWHTQLLEVRKEHMTEQVEFNTTVKKILRDVKRSVAASSSSSSSSSSSVPSDGSVAMDVAQGTPVDAAEDEEEEEDEDEELESLPDLKEEQLSHAIREREHHTKEIGLLECEREQLRNSSNGVNMGALMDWIKKNAQYKLRLFDLEQITAKRNEARKLFEDLRRQRLEMFMSGFGCITLKLKEMYQMITLGGDAELELVDSLDPFSEGIVFSVRPPKKSWKNISNLSGGEKTLSSLALVFSLHHYKPNALYVMDEIDAALDFKNVSIVANYIKERTKNAQFVIISLRNNMFELADRLVGIYKTFDATKSVTINPKVFAQATTGMFKASSEEVTEGEGKLSHRPSTTTTHSTNKTTTQMEKKTTTTLGDATNTRVLA